MNKIAEYAKAIVAAVVTAIVAAIADLDFAAIVGAALASGTSVGVTKNRKRD